MNAIFFVVLSLLFLACILLEKACRTFPLNELRRKARSGKDPKSARIYKLSSFGHSFELTLWLIGGLAFGGLVLLSAQFRWWLALIVIVMVCWVIWFGRPLNRYGGFAWSISSYLAPAVVWITANLQPALTRISNKIKSFSNVHIHTGLYEKEDLLDLIDKQKHQIDSRLGGTELKALAGALTFGDKLVSSVLIPRRVVKIVSQDEVVSPTLMDELYGSGFSRFPVSRGSSEPELNDITGTLYLRDLLRNLEKGGKVSDIMKKDAAFINDSHSLREALNAFIKTQHHLLIVVNNFEEFVGVLTLEDVMEQILGEKIIDEFDRYEDLRAVAGKESQAIHSNHQQSE